MLYQQGQRIEIIVRKEAATEPAGAKEKSAEETPNADQTSTADPSVDETNKAKTPNRFLLTNITHSIAVGKQIANNTVNYVIAGLSLSYGDQAYQQQIERQVEQISDASNIATSVAMGALYGSRGGPYGAIVGALLGGVSTGVNTMFKYMSRGREYDFKVFKEENGIQYQRARAGINLTTGRLR